MTTALQNILALADRDLAAGRCADAEAEYARLLEADADLYIAMHGRGAARAWQSTLWDGDPAALIASTDDALRMCRRAGDSEDAFLSRIASDLINLTSTKYNELTRIYAGIAGGENKKAPSPPVFRAWALSRPERLTLSDIYIPMINYLADLIRISEYLDGLLEGRDAFRRLRLHNIGNLAIFYDWLTAFNATGRLDSSCLAEITAKKDALAPVRARLEQECAVSAARPEGRPLPGAAVSADKVAGLAHFAARPQSEIICPVCGTIQNANRSICSRCSCKFVFDDEM